MQPVYRYSLPFLVYFGLTQLQSYAQGPTIMGFYTFKIGMTILASLYSFRGHWNEIPGRFDWKAVGLGIFVLIGWILSAKLFPQESVTTFSPENFNSPVLLGAAASVRILGACLVVPFVEEIFWRSFLMRYLIAKDFLSVPIGEYSHFSFWGTTIGFAVFHAPGQWISALIAGMIYGGYLVKTKNLRGSILSHAVTNAGLAAYVLVTREWQWWN